MRKVLEKYINDHYTDVRVWDFVDLGFSIQIRFTRSNALYIASMDKKSTVVEVFKLERSELL